jgi:hypothetical protein
MLDLASKKGIAITAAIAAGIVGASFLVWFVPQSSPGSIITDVPRTDEEIASDVYSRHIDMASRIDSDFAAWKNGTKTSDEVLGSISSARTETQQLVREIQRQPAQEWRQSYDLYEQALDVFGEYLSNVEAAVKGGDNTSASQQQELDSLKAEWQDYVDQSVQAMPASK